MTKVLLAWQDAERILTKITGSLPAGCELITVGRSPDNGPYEANANEVVRLAHNAEVIIGWHIPREAIIAASHLRMISAPHAGVDLFDFQLLREKGITLCNARGINAVPVAEHVLGLILGLAKRLTAHDASVKRTDWVEWSPKTESTLLEGKTIAIVGLGHIGREIAKRCKSFEMKVIGVRKRSVASSEYVDEVYTVEKLHEVLERSDFVVLAAPLTKDTQGIIGYNELAIMKPSAFLLNIGRGMLIKEIPLRDALVSGRIAGFASDVWWDYSLSMPVGYHYNVPSRESVHRLSNVIGTPNVAGNVSSMRDRMLDATLENVRQFLNGESLSRQVDLNAEY